jgi:hypothetical protein
MKPLRDALHEMAALPYDVPEKGHAGTSSTWRASRYAWFHRKLLEDAGADDLQAFLDANLDEIRLFYAEKFADAVLRKTDHDDAIYFRHGVLRREITKDMEFEKQRDHAAHTVNNYLLGWFVVCNSEIMSSALFDAFARRKPHWMAEMDSDYFYSRFGSIWMIPSLLHDVGYLFEGSLASLDARTTTEKARKGAEYVQDFFTTLFWEDIGLAPAALRRAAMEATNIEVPIISTDSLGTISDSLRDVGNLDDLWQRVLAQEPGFDAMLKGKLLVGDAFRLWEAHYRSFGHEQMAANVQEMEKVYLSLLRKGLPEIGLRIIDHGVAGGLLLMLHSTLFFRLLYGLVGKTGGAGAFLHEVERVFVEPAMHKYEASWWWTMITWATGAVAIHNVAQQFPPWKPGGETHAPLKLEDDPLAYLGILVDVLQEWDRYTSARNSVFTGKLPVSSNDVKVGVRGAVVLISFKDGEKEKKAKEDLGCLERWERVVKFEPWI